MPAASSWSRPPWRFGCGRCGWAKRRCLKTVIGCAFATARLPARFLRLFGAGADTPGRWIPDEAGAVGLGSFAPTTLKLDFAAAAAFASALGTGYSWAREPRPEYV